MNKFDSGLDFLDDSVGKPVKSQTYDSGLEGVSMKDTARASKSSVMRGQYWQRTLRLPPSFKDVTRHIYRETGARSIADIERWIYAMGLQAYLEGGERPEFSETLTRDVVLPSFSD
jgi:hypothetical protein